MFKPNAPGDQPAGVDQHAGRSAFFKTLPAQIARSQRDVDEATGSLRVGAGFSAANNLGLDVGRGIVEVDADKPLFGQFPSNP